MPGDPILLGTASGGATLVPDAGSAIKTDEYGIQRGTIDFQLGDQANAQNKRFAPGSPYSGSLPQFAGFLVDGVGDIIGGEGMTAVLPCTYARLDPLFKVLPQRTHDLEMRQVDLGISITGGVVALPTVPIPHPVLNYKFAAKKPTEQLGKYGSPPGAPEIKQYVYDLQFAAATSVTFVPGEELSGSDLKSYNLFDVLFLPDPAGWLCLKDDSIPICGGKLHQIDQQWKRFYILSGISIGKRH